MSFIFSPWFCITVGLTWSLITTIIVIKNEKEEGLSNISFPWWLIFVTGIGIFIAVLLPAPWNLSVALAAGGFIPAAWSDWRTTILWDEIIVPTGLFAAGAMMIGGRGGESLSGGVCVGVAYYLLWASMALIGKETGFGDVKLASTIGLVLGPLGGMIAIFVACFFGIAIWLYQKIKNKGPEIPYGPALTAGTLSTALVTPWLDQTYGVLLPVWFAVQP